MPLTLCPNCRLPVNTSVDSCPYCAATLPTTWAVRSVPVAAAVALLATVAVLAKRRA